MVLKIPIYRAVKTYHKSCHCEERSDVAIPIDFPPLRVLRDTVFMFDWILPDSGSRNRF